MTTQRFGFSKTKKLRKASEFSEIFSQSIRSRSPYFTILARPNNHQIGARLGVMVAKRVVKRAVQRNTIRRIVRESFRTNQHRLAGLDVIVMARGDVFLQSNAELYVRLKQQWQDLVTIALQKSIL